VLTRASGRAQADLAASEFEISIGGVTDVAPTVEGEKAVTVFVTFDLPFPSDAPQAGRTPTVKAPDLNPRLAYTERFALKRSRGMSRILARGHVNLELFQVRGGALRAARHACVCFVPCFLWGARICCGHGTLQVVCTLVLLWFLFLGTRVHKGVRAHECSTVCMNECAHVCLCVV
jgi:hypothetical protein